MRYCALEIIQAANPRFSIQDHLFTYHCIISFLVFLHRNPPTYSRHHLVFASIFGFQFHIVDSGIKSSLFSKVSTFYEGLLLENPSL